MAEIVSLSDAVREFVADEHVVALEGFTHLIPHAAAHELIRQGRRDLTLVRMTPDVIYDQLIGMGCARKLVFSWGGNPGVGSLHRLRDAVENGWPAPLELEEHSHAGMAAAYAAGRGESPVRCAPRLRRNRPGRAHTRRVHRVPVHRRAARRGSRPIVRTSGSSTPSRPTGTGTSSSGGSPACRRRSSSARGTRSSPSKRSSTGSNAGPVQSFCPSWVIDAVACVPRGAHPSYAHGYYERDNKFYVAWEAISRDRDTFTAWMREHVLEGVPV